MLYVWSQTVWFVRLHTFLREKAQKSAPLLCHFARATRIQQRNRGTSDNSRAFSPAKMKRSRHLHNQALVLQRMTPCAKVKLWRRRAFPLGPVLDVPAQINADCFSIFSLVLIGTWLPQHHDVTICYRPSIHMPPLRIADSAQILVHSPSHEYYSIVRKRTCFLETLMPSYAETLPPVCAYLHG